MSRAGALALVLLLGAVSTVRAQPRVRRVVTPTADVRDVVTVGDRTFLATDGGLLVMRDGAVLQRLGPGDGLPGARLRSLSHVDGALYVGGVEGVSRLRLDEPVAVERAWPLTRVRRVARLGGSILFASYGGGLHRLRDRGPGASPDLERIDLGRSGAYRRLTDLLVRGDELWVATHGASVVRLDVEGRIVGRVGPRDGLRNPYVWRLAERAGAVAILTVGGVEVFVDARGAVQRSHPWAAASRRLPVRDVRAVAWQGEALYLGTFGRGLHRVGAGGARPRRVGGFDAVHALDVRPDRVLVAHPEGFAEVRGGRATELLRGGLPSGDVTSLARAFGALWVGTFQNGLGRLRGGRAEPVATDRWSVDRRINDLAVTGRAGEQRLWIATDRGLFWHDGRRFSREEDPDGPSWVHTTSLHVDREGALWVTNSRQLCRLAARWRCWTGAETFPVTQLHAVATDRAGRVWVGGLHGLYRFEATRGRFTRHTVSSGALPVDWVTALAPYGRGIIAGTYHGGLSIGDGACFSIVREGDGGLPSGWINPHAIEVVDGVYYLGTLERGLVVGRPGDWQRVTTDDGLPSNDVTAVLAGPGGSWVGTRGGLAWVE
ncbi:MAG: hypothetical protein ACFCGT_23215 [Sandaracinaceae bacterium]